MKRKVVDLDGTTLEGGGQLFRLAIGLSSLTGQAVHIDKIRGKRMRGNKFQGGLKQAHLAGLAWLVKATHADVEGMEIKSTEVHFDPFSGSNPDSKSQSKVWKHLAKTGILVKQSEQSDESYIEIDTPGSVFLILQAILPFILFCWNGPRHKPVRLRVKGGTNVWHSLSYDYAEQVLFPVLHKHLGIGPIGMELVQRGWSTGQRSMGEVIFTIPPLSPTAPLPAFHLTNRGKVTRIEAFILCPGRDFGGHTIYEEIIEECIKSFEGVKCTCEREENSGEEAKIYLLLVAHTENGYRIGRDHLYSKKIDKNKYMAKVIRELVGTVTDALKKELAYGGCTDEYLRDQLVAFQALAEGQSTVEGPPEASLHTETARWVAGKVLGVNFDEHGHCEGIGFCRDSKDDPGPVEQGPTAVSMAKAVTETGPSI